MNGEWLKPPFEKKLEGDESEAEFKRPVVSRESELIEPTEKEKQEAVNAVLDAARWEKRRKAWDFVD